MKIPKEIKRYCPSCKTHTLQKVKNEKNRGKNKTHPMTKFSKIRLRLKRVWQGVGRGNSGRYSRGAQGGWKRFNKKQAKKPDFRFACTICKKTNVSADPGVRSKKIQVI